MEFDLLSLFLGSKASSKSPAKGGPASPAKGGKAAKAAKADPVATARNLGFAHRQMLLWLGFAVIMGLRLSMNAQEIIVDKKTNPGNHVEGFLNRALTKNYYVAMHAWLLLLPRTLCCDWSGGAIPVFSSPLDTRTLAVLALYGGGKKKNKKKNK